MTEDLRFRLSADDKASAVFARVRREIDGAGKSTAALRGALGMLAPALAGAFSVAGVVSFANAANEGLLKIKDLSEATGATYTSISGLEQVMVKAGGSLDDVSDILVKFNAALKDADRTKELGASFKALGLDVEKLRAMDPAQALLDVASAMERFEDDGNKARLTQELFGRSVRDAAPFLRELAEAGELHGEALDKQIEAADRFDKQLGAMKLSATNLARALSGPVVEAINSVVGAFSGTNQAADELSTTAHVLAVPLQALAVLGSEIVFVFKGVGTELGGIAAQAAALGKLDLAAVKAIRREMVADAEAARKAQDALTGRILGTNRGAALPQASYSHEGRNRPRPSLDLPAGGRTGGASKPRAAQIDEASQALARYVEGLSAAIQREQDLTAEQEAQQFLLGLGKTGENEQVRELVLGLAAEKDMREELAGQARLEAQARAAIIDKQLADQERLNRLLAATPGGKEQERLDTVLLINKAFDDGRISLQQWVELTDQLDANLETVAQTGKAAGEEIGLIFASAASDAITHWQGVGNLLKSIALDVSQMIVKKGVTEPLGNLVGNAMKDFDFGSIAKSVLGSIFGGGRAGGGSVQAGRLYEVNERDGPGELLRVGGRQYLMPRQDGTVVPQSGQASARGGAVNITINLPAGASPDDWRRSQRQIESGLQRSLRRAGAIA